MFCDMWGKNCVPFYLMGELVGFNKPCGVFLQLDVDVEQIQTLNHSYGMYSLWNSWLWSGITAEINILYMTNLFFKHETALYIAALCNSLKDLLMKCYLIVSVYENFYGAMRDVFIYQGTILHV